MKSEKVSLSAFSGIGLIAGVLAYWGLAHDPRASDVPGARTVVRDADATSGSQPTLASAKAENALDTDSPPARDEVFKIFPEDQWIKVPRGLMEQGNSGVDWLTCVLGQDDQDQAFLHAMMPDADKPTVQTIASLISKFSRDWTEVAAASMQRSGPDEWQLSLPPERVTRLREDFAQNLTKSLGPGYAHLAGLITFKSLAMAGGPSMTLTFDSTRDLWFLNYKQGEGGVSSTIRESSLGKNAPIRPLLERARSSK